MMTSSETLIAALERIQRGQFPEDLQNILRALHHDYAETTESRIRRANGAMALRRYDLQLTSAGEGLLEAVEG